MLFKDRVDAGEQLANLLSFLKNKDEFTIVSLLRGGIIVGEVLSKALGAKHLPLIVKKIPHPQNSELAIGAICYDIIYLDPFITDQFEVDRTTLEQAISQTRKRFYEYEKTFGLKKNLYFSLKNKMVFLTDDGIATGSSMRAAALFLRSISVKKILLGVPVVPTDFDRRGFDMVFVFKKESDLNSVSQAYENFSQVNNEEVLDILRNKISLNKQNQKNRLQNQK